jgi:tetratricopeptide (TPR) repeat protein
MRTSHRIWLGREHELAELEAGLDALRLGRGGLFLITGEPGIGKTRLADELGQAALARGIAVHWGRAWEAGGAPSFWPFIQVLRSMLRGLSEHELRNFGTTQRAELAELIPELAGKTDTAPSSGHATRERFHLFDAVECFLRLGADKSPQVIVLDDLHAADRASLLLLQFIAKHLRTHAVLVIGTYREAEARLAPEIAGVVIELARDACLLPLRRLDRVQVADYFAQTTGSTPLPERVEAIYELSEGNPLFLRELLQLHPLVAGRPESIREVVRTRLSLLTPPLCRLLQRAAVLGREFDVATLTAIAPAGENAIEVLLASGADAGIVEPLHDQVPRMAPRAAPRWRFTHVLLREGLYESIAPEERAGHHRRAAAELARDPRDDTLAEIAHHLIRATPLVSAGEAADATLKAAQRAMDVLAFEDASALLERALVVLQQAPDEQERLFEVELALGMAHIKAAEVECGQLACRRALERARQLGDGERFARAVLGSAYEFTPGIRNPELIALLEQALALLSPADGSLRARCMAQLAAERQPEPDTAQPLTLARAAVAMARRIGDDDTLRFTLTAASLAMMVYSAPEERRAISQEALRLALAAGDRRVALRAHLLLANDCWEEGDVSGAAAHTQSYETLARQFRHGGFDWIAAGLRAVSALWHGQFAEARRLYDQSLGLLQQDQTHGLSMAALPIGMACTQERYDDAAAIETSVRAAFSAKGRELGSCIGEMLIAELYGRAGDVVRSAAQLATVKAHPVFAAITEPAWLALLADACHTAGDSALAEKLYPVLLPRAKRLFNLGHLGPCCEPPYSRQLGLLAETLGRFDQAVDHCIEAQTITELAGMRAFYPRLRYELGRALVARNRGDDRRRAAVLLEEAHGLAEELGQTGLLRLIATLDAKLSDSARLATATHDGTSMAFTLAREGEYWTIVHGGRTLRLRSSRGLEALALLVENAGRELHVLQIISGGEGTRDHGDAGAVLDGAAIHGYRARLLELREELEEAEANADRGRAERAREEMEFLTHELASAVGLGGRERRSGAAAERARTTVQKRLRSALARIRDGLPELATHLEQSIRTGAFCGYLPAGRPPRRRSRERQA